MRLLFFAALLLPLAACTEPEPAAAPRGTGSPPELAVRPSLTSAADSLAWRVVQAHGGLDAWQGVSRLRFDFAVVRDSVEAFRAKHLWDRTTGRYRVEYPVGEDSVLVALFDAARFRMDAPAGTVYLNGVAVGDTAATARLREAYERHVNDAYWLLAPLKLFDPGVRRALDPDSAGALVLSFENVGLTPGDRYWLWPGADGRVARWSFVLEGGTRASHDWRDVVSLPTAHGALHLPTTKRTAGRAIRTPVFSAEGLPEDVFQRPAPAL